MGWERLRAAEATALGGIETIVWLDSLDALLQPWIHAADHIYLNSNENDRKGSTLETRDYRYAQEMKRRYPLHNYERSAKIMRNVRAVKSKFEVDAMQTAIDITEKHFAGCFQFIKPGVMEYEIEAELVHEFLRNRQEGKPEHYCQRRRARTLHYVFNNEACKDGELVLMDFGANYGGYAADLTRTVPVNVSLQTPERKCTMHACICITTQSVLLKPEHGLWTTTTW